MTIRAFDHRIVFDEGDQHLRDPHRQRMDSSSITLVGDVAPTERTISLRILYPPEFSSAIEEGNVLYHNDIKRWLYNCLRGNLKARGATRLPRLKRWGIRAGLGWPSAAACRGPWRLLSIALGYQS